MSAPGTEPPVVRSSTTTRALQGVAVGRLKPSASCLTVTLPPTPLADRTPPRLDILYHVTPFSDAEWRSVRWFRTSSRRQLYNPPHGRSCRYHGCAATRWITKEYPILWYALHSEVRSVLKAFYLPSGMADLAFSRMV